MIGGVEPRSVRWCFRSLPFGPASCSAGDPTCYLVSACGAQSPNLQENVMRRVSVRVSLAICICLSASGGPGPGHAWPQGGPERHRTSAPSEPDGTNIDLDRRTTFGGGAYLPDWTGRGALTLQAEALYTPRKGAQGEGRECYSRALSYIDVPLLFLVRVPAGDAAIWPDPLRGPRSSRSRRSAELNE